MTPAGFGEIYYVSLCVLFRRLGSETRPKFYKAHARIRAEHLGENTEEYLNLEKEIDGDVRKKRF
ncbi:hypothetical protein HYW87_02400 [Candidatus Roizmanbacteria bacterium]|nr:hypothetical protein [Candidatus Roizmanbacteria bacterium]